jgi:Protein of unknown function (DUF998)
METAMNSRNWARVALVAVASFLILLVVLHFIEPEFDPSKRLISEYQLGRYGWVMSLAFFSLGVGVLATLLSTWDFSRSRRGLIGRWWLLAISVAFFGAGIFYPYTPPNLACDRYFSNCGYALQFCLSSQPDLDCITGAAAMGNRVGLGGINLVCGIDYRFRNHASRWQIKFQFTHRLAK